ncbi:putative thioredoxin-like protein [Phaeoacremonium minimum UCRPA7]|uniref:Putative thioredoxin-like protein n=1 Tax=Phaeoacremonium minimum (strain UCR-PA7) TaxID=1286976 RepID=R8BMV4_PHAM7|nr:putative thioredoxin-like protein [Phaeoacremonium minimum UCRPA7]EOO00674.1 putative thioredoxin-like protein [Phaeoacremonium minimum UCRPA7]
MALAPKFKGHRLLFFQDDPAAPAPTESFEPLHTIELYLDYVCPFSAKLFKTFVTDVAPKIRADPALAQKMQVIFRQQIQPWHPSSTLVHEAGVAVLKLAPGKFWDFSAALFAAQKDYFDVNVVNEGRNQTYARLAKLAAGSTGVSEAEYVKLLQIPETAADDGSLNVGNGVTNDLKLLIKAARLVGVHVSPTVIFDGIVNNDISSGWTADQWLDWLKKNVA